MQTDIHRYAYIHPEMQAGRCQTEIQGSSLRDELTFPRAFSCGILEVEGSMGPSRVVVVAAAATFASAFVVVVVAVLSLLLTRGAHKARGPVQAQLLALGGQDEEAKLQVVEEDEVSEEEIDALRRRELVEELPLLALLHVDKNHGYVLLCCFLCFLCSLCFLLCSSCFLCSFSWIRLYVRMAVNG
jgi:hypothetical protein